MPEPPKMFPGKGPISCPLGQAELLVPLVGKFALKPLSSRETAERPFRRSTQLQHTHRVPLNLILPSVHATIGQKHCVPHNWENCNGTPVIRHNCTYAPIETEAVDRPSR